MDAVGRVVRGVFAFLFGLVISAIVAFYLYPMLVQSRFPGADLAAAWLAVTEWVVFLIGTFLTVVGVVWISEGRSE